MCNGPSQCPVCHGKGFVPTDFYNPPKQYPYTVTFHPFGSVMSPPIVAGPQPCRTCEGKGIVWPNELLAPYPNDLFTRDLPEPIDLTPLMERIDDLTRNWQSITGMELHTDETTGEARLKVTGTVWGLAMPAEEGTDECCDCACDTCPPL